MAKNRTMQAKNEKRRRLEQKMRKEHFYMRASHHIWAEHLPASTVFFFQEDMQRKTWRQWAHILRTKEVFI